MLNELDRAPLGPAEQLLEPPLPVDQWQVAQVVAIVLDQVEGVQYRLMAPLLAPQRIEVRCPLSWAITASPSIRNDDAGILLAASAMAGKRSAQSWPLRVKQRTRAPSRRTISR